MKSGLLLLPLMLLSGCPASREPPAVREPPDTGQPALHAVHNDRLKALMEEMNSLVYDRMAPEPELDRTRRQYVRQIEETATELSGTVDAITAALPSLRLSPGEQTRFRNLALKLRIQAQRLRDQAHQNQVDAIPFTFDHLVALCSDCHRLFRKLEN